MSEYMTRAEALKLLRERTGRAYTMGIFSKRLRRDRVWAFSREIYRTDVENFLRRREQRIARSNDEVGLLRIARICEDLCARDTTLKNLAILLKSSPEAVKHLKSARGALAWAVIGLLNAQRALREAKGASVGSTGTPAGGSGAVTARSGCATPAGECAPQPGVAVLPEAQ